VVERGFLFSRLRQDSIQIIFSRYIDFGNCPIAEIETFFIYRGLVRIEGTTKSDNGFSPPRVCEK
jgi:hypothetical protein